MQALIRQHTFGSSRQSIFTTLSGQ